MVPLGDKSQDELGPSFVAKVTLTAPAGTEMGHERLAAEAIVGVSELNPKTITATRATGQVVLIIFIFLGIFSQYLLAI